MLDNREPLVLLDLSGNEITPDGVEALGACVAQLPNLEKFLLEDNELGAEGCTALAAVLAPPAVVR